MKKSTVPWARYMGKGAKAALKKGKRVKLSAVMSLVFDCLASKVVADTRDDQACRNMHSHLLANHRTSLPEFVKDSLLHKFGLPSMADAQLFAVVDAVRKHQDKNVRLRIFGEMCGVVNPEKFTPRLSDMILAFYVALFPKFSAASLRNRKVGDVSSLFELEQVRGAFETIYRRTKVAFSIGTQTLTNGLWDKTFAKLQEIAVPFAQRAPGAAEAESVATDGESQAGASASSLRRAETMRKVQEAQVAADAEAEPSGKFAPEALVVDLDDATRLVIDSFYEQCEQDKVDLQEALVKFDDDGNGQLSVSEFREMMTFLTTEALSDADLLALFKEMQTHDATEEEGMPDEVSPDAFWLMCYKHGISVPPPETARPAVLNAVSVAGRLRSKLGKARAGLSKSS